MGPLTVERCVSDPGWGVQLLLTTERWELTVRVTPTGADTLAGDWAHGFLIPVRSFPADWEERHGKRAGPIRNQMMLEEGRPDLVVAFPGGTGTADMVRRAREAGVEVMEVDRG